MGLDPAGVRLGTIVVRIDPDSSGGIGGLERRNHGGLGVVLSYDAELGSGELGDELLERRDVISVGGDGTLVGGDGVRVGVDVQGIGGC